MAAGIGIGFAPPSIAGPPTGSEAAVVEGEVARRQQQITDAERLIGEGDAFAADGDFGSAAAKYGEAFVRLTPSPLSQDTVEVARLRFSAASVRHALTLIDGARFAEAETALDRVLDASVNPTYGPALEIKTRLQDPEWYNTARTPEHQANVVEVTRLLRLGEGAMRLGNYQQALDHYTQVLRIDRTNAAARRGMAEAEAKVVAYLDSARDHTRLKLMREVDNAWETEVKLSGAFGLGGDDLIDSTPASDVTRKLREIIIDRIAFDGMALGEAVDLIERRARDMDPAGEGVSIVVGLDPTDQFAASTPITFTLADVPLGEVLRYLTELTGTKYRAEGYAVRIESASALSRAMVNKSWRVPPGFLTEAAAGGAGPAVNDPFADPQPGSALVVRRVTAQEFLERNGVTFPDGASARFNPSTSTIFVRNTQDNLAIVDALVSAARGEGAKQLNIAVTVIEIAQTDLNELGMDFLLGHSNIPGSDRIFSGGGSYGNSASSTGEPGLDFPFVPPGSNIPTGQYPLTAGLRSGRQWNEGDAINNILLNGEQSVASSPASLRAPSLFSVAGPFTDPQVQWVLRGLAQAKGAEIMTKPTIVTKSGQRATIDVVREFIYPTEYDPPEIPQDIGLDVQINGQQTSLASDGQFPVTPAHPTAFDMRPVGTHLEVDGVIGPDNRTIDLNLTPEVVRFEGFVNYGSPISTTSTDALGGEVPVQLTDNRILMPIFKTLRQNTAVTIWDGQTVVFGGLVEDRINAVADKVPLFGDVPLFGRMFRSQGEDRSRRVVLFMVRAEIIDAGGRLVNQQ